MPADGLVQIHVECEFEKPVENDAALFTALRVAEEFRGVVGGEFDPVLFEGGADATPVARERGKGGILFVVAAAVFATGVRGEGGLGQKDDRAEGCGRCLEWFAGGHRGGSLEKRSEG